MASQPHSPREAAAHYLTRVPGEPDGGRDNHTIGVACRVRERFDLSEEELVDVIDAWNRGANTPPLGPRDIRRICRSACERTEYQGPAPSPGAPPRRRTGQRRTAPGQRSPRPDPEPAAPLPDDEQWQTYREQLVEREGPHPETARQFLRDRGVDPEACGWGLGRVTSETCATHRLRRGSEGTRFYIPVHHPETGELWDVRRYAPAPFRDPDADETLKTCPWAKGTGRAKPYRWHELPPPGSTLIYCEGELDAEVLLALGYHAIACTNGANSLPNVLSEWGHLLLEYRVLLWFDCDAAGEKATAECVAACQAIGITHATAAWPPDSPQGFDFADAVVRDGPEAVRDLVRWRLEVAEWDVPPTPRPELSTDGRQLAEVVDEALDLLRRSNDPPTLYLRGGRMVRVERDETGWPLIADVGEHALRGRLARVAEWTGSRGRPIDPPAAVSQTILHEPDLPLPPLVGITQVPTIRPDGTVLSEPGYDAPTHLVYAPPPDLAVPPVPVEPSEAEVAAARERLLSLVSEFPFVDDASRANLLALWLTPVIRAAVSGPVPMAVVDAPSPGTGKSLLVEVVCRTVAGRSTALTAPSDEDEWRKRLTALLMGGASVVVIDNLVGKLQSHQLAAAITADWWEDRELGRSGMIRVQQRATWVATGNNVSMTDELARRCYWVRLDARVARPWERTTFRITDLRGHVDAHRGEILAAMLTLARAWWTAGQPAAEVRPLGGFQGWTRLTAGILAHAGVEGLLSNQLELYEQSDDGSAEMEAFLRAWRRVWGDEPVRVAQLVGALEDDGVPAVQELRECWPSWGLAGSGHPDARRFGTRLRQYVDRRYGSDGIRLSRAETDSHSKTARWQVLVDAGSAGSCGISPTQTRENGKASDPNCRNGGGDLPQDPALPATQSDDYDPFGTEEPYRG